MYFGLDMNSLPQVDISSYRRFSKSEKHITRIFEWDVLIIMLSGELNFREDGVDISLKGGEYYIQRRGLKQEGIITSEGAVYYYIHFIGSYLNDGGLPLRGTCSSEFFLKTFEKLDLLNATNGTTVEKSYCFYKILSNLYLTQPKTEAKQLTDEITEYMYQHLSAEITLESIAKKFGYSKNHVINIFKRETGKTPFEYLRDIRLVKAKSLLEYSHMSLENIATESGFGNYINFYKAFKAKYGSSPRIWKGDQLSLGSSVIRSFAQP